MNPLKIKFNNGFRAIYEPSKNDFPITTFYILCDVGSVHEENDERGYSHFIEHMCFKGTTHVKSQTIFKMFDELGIYYNAFTVKRYTGYVVKCNDEHFSTCISIISDMLLNSTFEKKEFQKELQVVIEENIKSLENNEELITDLIEKMTYNGTNYENPVDCLSYHNHSYDYDSVMKFYKKYYVVNNMILSVVSNLTFRKIVQALKKTHFMKNEKGSLPSIIFPKCVVFNETEKFNFKKIPTSELTYISISFRTCSRYENEKYALNLLKEILGGYFSSRLFTILREQNGLTYTSYVSTQYYETMGDFTVFAMTDPSKLLKDNNKEGVLPILVQIINDLYKNGITQQELNIAKQNKKMKIILKMENMENIVSHNGKYLLFYENNKKFIPYEKKYETCYKNITMKEINKIIQKYFIYKNMNVCILGKKIPSDKNMMDILKNGQ